MQHKLFGIGDSGGGGCGGAVVSLRSDANCAPPLIINCFHFIGVMHTWTRVRTICALFQSFNGPNS